MIQREINLISEVESVLPTVDTSFSGNEILNCQKYIINKSKIKKGIQNN